MALTVAFAALAGILSTLSPCVLPLIPIVLATAAGKHRLGPAALAGGLALSFTAIGLFVATVGFAIGLDGDVFRKAGGALLVALGALLLLPRLQARVSVAAGPIGNWTEQRFGGTRGNGWRGQFGVGLLLGAVWSPCVGPTLGAASVMAARGENLGQVAITMAAFGIGAALPLLVLGLLSREALVRWRSGLLATGSGGRQAAGALLLAVGLLVVSGLDKRAETWLVEASPPWLTRLTTSF
jgi:cytochrome c-type biogenesis protein